MKKQKNNKGITLIALVITIIVLLILAAISIATLTGENGLLTKATQASKESEISEAIERARIDIIDWIAEQKQNNKSAELTNGIIQNLLTGKDYVKEANADSFITKSGKYEITYEQLYSAVEEGPAPEEDKTIKTWKHGIDVVSYGEQSRSELVETKGKINIEENPELINDSHPRVLDIYKIADVQLASGKYDVEYVLLEQFEEILSDVDDLKDESQMLQKEEEIFTKLCNSDNIDITPDYTGLSLETPVEDLDTGMYFLVCRAGDIEDWVNFDVVYGIVKIPTVVDPENREAYHEITVSCNATPTSELKGSVKITNTLNSSTSKPLSFIYSVTGTLNGEPVYSDIVSFSHTSKGKQSVTIDNILQGTEITIEPIYISDQQYYVTNKDESITIKKNTTSNYNIEVALDGQENNNVTSGLTNFKITYNEEEGQWKSENTAVADGFEVRITDITDDHPYLIANVTVTNNQNQEIYARVRAIVSDAYACSYSGESWEPKDDEYYQWYDYNIESGVIEKGDSTGELLIKIENIPEEPSDGETFNVSIVVETTKVLYDDDGNPYAEWTGTTSEGGEG